MKPKWSHLSGWLLMAGCSNEITDPNGWLAEGYVTARDNGADNTQEERRLLHVPIGAAVTIEGRFTPDADDGLQLESLTARAGGLDLLSDPTLPPTTGSVELFAPGDPTAADGSYDGFRVFTAGLDERGLPVPSNSFSPWRLVYWTEVDLGVYSRSIHSELHLEIQAVEPF